MSRIPSGAALAALLLLSACATLLGGGSSQAVSVRSGEQSAHFVIRSSSGIEVVQGNTPEVVRLPRKNEYQLEFTAPGFQPQKIALTKGTNGWIFGNLIVGWIVGFAVDFATGSAYKLEPAVVDITMVRSTDSTGKGGTSAAINMYDQSGRRIRELVVPLVPLPLRKVDQ